MGLQLGWWTIDALDAPALAHFWKQLLGWPRLFTDDSGIALVPQLPPTLGQGFLLYAEHETGPKRHQNRAHLDLRGPDQQAMVAGEERRTPRYQTALAARLHDIGATALFLHEVRGLGTGVDATEGLSTMANDVLLLRYMERGSELGRVLSVLKMRRSDHDKGLLQYEITDHGFTVVGEAADVRHITGWTVLGGSTAM